MKVDVEVIANKRTRESDGKQGTKKINQKSSSDSLDKSTTELKTIDART